MRNNIGCSEKKMFIRRFTDLIGGFVMEIQRKKISQRIF